MAAWRALRDQPTQLPSPTTARGRWAQTAGPGRAAGCLRGPSRIPAPRCEEGRDLRPQRCPLVSGTRAGEEQRVQAAGARGGSCTHVPEAHGLPRSRPSFVAARALPASVGQAGSGQSPRAPARRLRPYLQMPARRPPGGTSPALCLRLAGASGQGLRTWTCPTRTRRRTRTHLNGTEPASVRPQHGALAGPLKEQRDRHVERPPTPLKETRPCTAPEKQSLQNHPDPRAHEGGRQRPR